jgi:hypothetical protein
MPNDDLNTDQELWAARVRLHFEPDLRDPAEEVARILVPVVGRRIKELRPETHMGEILRWLKDQTSVLTSSLDWVELMMMIEEQMGTEITDEFAERLEEHAFREFVVHLVGNRRRLSRLIATD